MDKVKEIARSLLQDKSYFQTLTIKSMLKSERMQETISCWLELNSEDKGKMAELLTMDGNDLILYNILELSNEEKSRLLEMLNAPASHGFQ